MSEAIQNPSASPESPSPFEPSSLEKAKTMLTELIDGAKAGTLVPVRLAGQLEAVAALLNEPSPTLEAPAPLPVAAPDLEALKADQAGFFGHAIHELRTPMTSIRGYADMLNNAAMGALNPMQKQFLDTIRNNTRRLESLMLDVSDINKLRAGTLKMSPKMDMFKNIAMMVEKAMAPTAESLGATLTFETPTGLPFLNVDGDVLTRALNKWVENGLRYHQSDAENKRVIVRGASETDEAGKQWLLIEIEDNGIGMSAEESKLLGTLYYRADNDVVRDHKGSGLGIPIAYGMVEEMGGSVRVRSTPGEGTTFTVRLPTMASG